MSKFRDKIYIIGDNPELSAIIQRELFEQGYRWPGSNTEVLPDVQGIYCYTDGSITHGMPHNIESDINHKSHEIINLSGWRCFKHGGIEKPKEKRGIALTGAYGFDLASCDYKIANNEIWLSSDNLPKPDHLLIGHKRPPDPRLKIIQRLMDAINSNHKQIERLEDEIENDKTPLEKACDNIRELHRK